MAADAAAGASVQGRDGPTTAQLKRDIDSGRTGDKVEVYDVGLSPLGTDDEAAGRPPSAARVALARFNETVGRWRQGARRTGAAHSHPEWEISVFVGFIGLVAVAIGVGIWALR